ncbi:hypothetical protein [Streptococcus suis]|uniref:DUF7675 family protein n=1 Tax=Streptococcus suis TaxID=1307 RepID=UPI000CF3B9BA|nr:hypothetical protein [Streptococcus suis]
MTEVMDNLQKLDIDNRVFSTSTIPGFSDWYKENENCQVWWVEELGMRGRYLFSFDKKKVYNLFSDYPYNMTTEEVKIFDQENPYWAEFFSYRK